VHRLAQRLAGNDRAAALAALGVALGPAFVMTPFQILTESLFTMLVVLAILLYVRAQRSPTGAGVTAAAVVFGLAAMTRPVVWLLPMALAVHLMALRGRRRGLRWASVLLGGYLVTLAPWHAYLYAATGSPMPQGLLANLWLGATGEGRWTGRQAMDDRRRRFQGGDEDYANEALAAIRANPLGWARLRATRMAEAVLQPHGTQDLTGPPVKSAIASVVRGDAPPRVLWPHAASGTFWLKAAIYAFHYAALLLGAVGMWQVRHAWRDWFGPYAIIVYLCLVHGALTVLPRYLFPATPFLWIFAAASVARMRGWRS
jgi:4-amino-4-deoxy-L-arabinose transferase-like glycosyltransferase